MIFNKQYLAIYVRNDATWGHMLSKANSKLYAFCRVVLFHWLWVTPNYHYPQTTPFLHFASPFLSSLLKVELKSWNSNFYQVMGDRHMITMKSQCSLSNGANISWFWVTFKTISDNWNLFMTAHSNEQVIIFLPCGFFFYLLLSFFRRLISAVADLMSIILLHMAWP